MSSKGTGLFKNAEDETVIYQRPNLPIIGWAIAMLVSFVTEGNAQQIAASLGFALLFTWAYLEIRQGASLFRKMLGSIVMISILLSLFVNSGHITTS